MIGTPDNTTAATAGITWIAVYNITRDAATQMPNWFTTWAATWDATKIATGAATRVTTDRAIDDAIKDVLP